METEDRYEYKGLFISPIKVYTKNLITKQEELVTTMFNVEDKDGKWIIAEDERFFSTELKAKRFITRYHKALSRKSY